MRSSRTGIVASVTGQGHRAPTLILGGDVSAAFRHVGIHSQCVKYFCGRIPEANALVVDLFAPFGWTLSPAEYEVFGGAIAHIHGSTASSFSKERFFNYHWVDDHINVVRALPNACEEAERSLRHAMISVLGSSAVNEKKFTGWHRRLKVLGLIFNTENLTVSMPDEKVGKAKLRVASVLHCTSVSRTEFRSLLGSLRHVATCVRPARAFLQRLRLSERRYQRSQRIAVTAAMTDDLRWWLHILQSAHLNGIPLRHFGDLPPADVHVFVDASNYGLCAADVSSQYFLTYQFDSTDFDINFRELLTLAFAVNVWGKRWGRPRPFPPTHVRFHSDNISAISWQSRLSSRNPRAQTIIRLLALWEVDHNVRFSSVHVPGHDNTLADLGSRTAQTNSSDIRSLLPDLATHFRQHSVAPSTLKKYTRAFEGWSSFCNACGADPYLRGLHASLQVDLISQFILAAQARGLRGSSIDGHLSGIRHMILAAGHDGLFSHPQIRMLLKGIRRFDAPPSTKTPVSLQLLTRCYHQLNRLNPADRMLWGVLCMAFFFLLRRSEIAANGRIFQWFALRDEDVAILDTNGSVTHNATAAQAVAIRLRGSKTNQLGKPTHRLLQRSGHPFVCPVFAALCMKAARGAMSPSSPIASYVDLTGRQRAVSAANMTFSIRKAAQSLGLKESEFSAHSLRSGGATQMYKAGVDMLTIQFHGRWVSDAFKLYTRLTDETASRIASAMLKGQSVSTD